MPVALLIDGPAWRIYGWLEEDTCQVKDYLGDLAANNNPDAEAIIHLLDTTAKYGAPSNPQKFKNLGDGLVEFKARHGTRILAFLDRSRRRIICTHAIPKLKPVRFRRAMERALSVKESYDLEQTLRESDYVN